MGDILVSACPCVCVCVCVCMCVYGASSCSLETSCIDSSLKNISKSIKAKYLKPVLADKNDE